MHRSVTRSLTVVIFACLGSLIGLEISLVSAHDQHTRVATPDFINVARGSNPLVSISSTYSVINDFDHTPQLGVTYCGYDRNRTSVTIVGRHGYRDLEALAFTQLYTKVPSFNGWKWERCSTGGWSFFDCTNYMLWKVGYAVIVLNLDRDETQYLHAEWGEQFDSNIQSHEMGHVVGLGHLHPDETVRDPNDPLSVMMCAGCAEPWERESVMHLTSHDKADIDDYY